MLKMQIVRASKETLELFTLLCELQPFCNQGGDHPHPFPSRVEAIEEQAITLGDRVGA